MTDKIKEVYVVSTGFYIWMMVLTVMLIFLVFSEIVGLKRFETKEEFFLMDSGIKEYNDVEYISCQKGADIGRYGDRAVIYGCMSIEGHKCSGNGKMCYVKYKVEMDGNDR